MLVASRHQLKELVRLSWRQFGIADLIDDQHTGAGVATQALAHQTRIGSTFQGLRQVRERGEERRIAGGQCLDRERQTEVGFPRTRRSQKQDIRGRLHKREIGQFPQQPLGEAGLKGKLKGFQRFERRQASRAHAPLGGAPSASLDLGSNRAAEKGFIGPLFLPSRLIEGR